MKEKQEKRITIFSTNSNHEYITQKAQEIGISRSAYINTLINKASNDQ